MNLPPADSAALLDHIGRAATVLLITHVSPDSDAIGSLLGLTHALRGLGKIVTPACSDPLRDHFNFLPGDTEVVTRASGPIDLVIALDCGDESPPGQRVERTARAPTAPHQPRSSRHQHALRPDSTGSIRLPPRPLKSCWKPSICWARR